MFSSSANQRQHSLLIFVVYLNLLVFLYKFHVISDQECFLFFCVKLGLLSTEMGSFYLKLGSFLFENEFIF